MKYSITFVGLDVHKGSITVALADDGRDGEVHTAYRLMDINCHLLIERPDGK